MLWATFLSLTVWVYLQSYFNVRETHLTNVDLKAESRLFLNLSEVYVYNIIAVQHPSREYYQKENFII